MDVSSFQSYINLKTQTTIGAIQGILLFLAGVGTLSMSGPIYSNERFSFLCEKESSLTRQACLDAYNNGLNILQAYLLIPAINFAVPLLMMIISGVVIHRSAIKLRSREFKHSNSGCVFHIPHVYLVQLIARIVFLATMVSVISSYASSGRLEIGSKFECNLSQPSPMGNWTKTILCVDSKAKDKSNVNIAILVIDCVFLLLALIELVQLCVRWYCKPNSSASDNTRERQESSEDDGKCSDCKQFVEKLLYFTKEDLEVVELDKLIGDSVAPQPGTPTTSTDDRVQSSSEKLKDKYKKEYKFHTITSVKGSDLEQREVALEKFAVDVTVVEEVEVTDLPNERSEYISKLHGIRSQHSVELKELVDRKSEERVSFVRGLAGIGKTVLTKQIALKWAEGTIFQEFSHLYSLKCRDLNNETSLDDFLQREFYGESVPEGNKVLFIIDGIDEVVDLEENLKNKNSIIYQLLYRQSNRFVGSKVILTSRPHVQTILKECVEVTGNMKKFEMIGLSEKSINEYINLFTEKESQKEEEAAIQKAAIQKTRESSQNISVLMSIPQYLQTLCCVAILTEGNAISNTTELYTWLLFVFFKSHINKDVKYITDLFSDDYFNFIKTFGKISYELLLKKTIVFKQEDFTEELKELTDNQNMKKMFDAFCIEVGGLAQKFQFRHLTLQEFFGSLHCLIDGVEPEVLVQNNNFEILTFMCGFYGSLLKTEDEESEIKDLVAECLKGKGEWERKGFLLRMFKALKNKVTGQREEKEGQFLLRVLKALYDDQGKYHLGRALDCTVEYVNPIVYSDKEIIKDIIDQLFRFMPPTSYSEGLNCFDRPSSIDQSNFEKLIEVAHANNLLQQFKNVNLLLFPLSNFNLFKYFKYFGFVYVSVEDVSVDKLNLFKDCIYCNEVTLYDCKLVEHNLDLSKLKEILEANEEQSRLEQLWLQYCEIDEGNWTEMIYVIARIKSVTLFAIKMEKSEWSNLVDVIEEYKGRLKLEKLEFYDCNIDDQLVERIREAGVFVWE